jgi:hypothetical protein
LGAAEDRLPSCMSSVWMAHDDEFGCVVQESFFGKLLLHVVVFGVLLVRSSSDVEKYKNLLDEATFYDKQWNATWEGQVRPSEQEKSQ